MSQSIMLGDEAIIQGSISADGTHGSIYQVQFLQQLAIEPRKELTAFFANCHPVIWIIMDYEWTVRLNLENFTLFWES